MDDFKFQLVDTSYIYDHTLFRLFRGCIILYGIFLIVFSATRPSLFADHSTIISYISSSFVGIAGFSL